jgi:ferredoxin
MANKINDECIQCGACEPECPNEAISNNGATYVIDAAKCDECAANGGEFACAAVCPTDAVVPA